jgi:hypothetical protein
MKPLRTGDPVTIGYDGRTVPGVVKLASPNGQSLMLEFEAVLRGHLGMMPVLGDGAGGFRDLMHGQPVTLARRPA